MNSAEMFVACLLVFGFLLVKLAQNVVKNKKKKGKKNFNLRVFFLFFVLFFEKKKGVRERKINLMNKKCLWLADARRLKKAFYADNSLKEIDSKFGFNLNLD